MGAFAGGTAGVAALDVVAFVTCFELLAILDVLLEATAGVELLAGPRRLLPAGKMSFSRSFSFLILLALK